MDAGVGSRIATKNFGERVGPTDEGIFCFGKLLGQLTESRPFATVRKACVRPPCGSKPTDTWEAAADTRTNISADCMSCVND